MILSDALGNQPGREKDNGQAGAGMCACANEIEITVARVPVVWAQVADLPEVVAQTEGRALGQIEVVFILRRAECGFVNDVLANVAQAQALKLVENSVAGTLAQGVPVLRMCAVDVARWHKSCDCVALGRRNRRSVRLAALM